MPGIVFNVYGSDRKGDPPSVGGHGWRRYPANAVPVLRGKSPAHGRGRVLRRDRGCESQKGEGEKKERTHDRISRGMDDDRRLLRWIGKKRIAAAKM